MREIEFRGKLVHAINALTKAGDWVQGDLWVKECGVYIREKSSVIGLEVDPETVGEYTGLKDRNGTMIFEGDVIEWSEVRRWGVVEFEYGKFIIKYLKTSLPSGSILCGNYTPPKQDIVKQSYACKVIGNIHDNPELLKDVNK